HTLYAAAGTYDTTLGENFPILIKNSVSLVGAGIDISIIDANSTNSVIHCISIVDASTRIEGFTITEGSATSGAGFYISAGSTLTIKDNKITSNTSSSDGGGFYVIDASPKIIDNTISGNKAGVFDEGDALYLSNSSALIKSNTIIQNINSNAYSCLYIIGATSSPRIIHNIIAKNSHGGIDCIASNPIIINNTISDNTGDGIYIATSSLDSLFNNIISLNSGYGINESGSSSDPGKVWYNLFYANSSGLYHDEGTTDYYTASSLNTGVAECENNIDGDPMFVDRVNGDYHLQLGSPAIDAGDPSFDFSYEPSPNGGRINIGAYGNTTEATTNDAGPPPLPNDIYVDATTGNNSTGDGT
ncbi:MAG: right-handed parallel beta-helix repeat-containing protein, partial [Thermoplasmatales archaeon]|nr:right-handed parallel beta-helix repeat-containing protein [Thermoplasmatales archaeon]